MRFLTYRPKSAQPSSRDRVGALTSEVERAVDLTANFGSLLALIDRGDEGLAVARNRFAERRRPWRSRMWCCRLPCRSRPKSATS